MIKTFVLSYSNIHSLHYVKKIYDSLNSIPFSYKGNFCSEAALERCSLGKTFCKFNEITLWHVCSPVNLLHIFRIAFPKGKDTL